MADGARAAQGEWEGREEKHSPTGMVREELRRIAALVAAGELPPECWRQMQQGVVAILVEESTRLAKLSEREQEVWRLRCEGLSSREIGARLALSENTVNTHVQNIHMKLEACGVCEVVLRHWQREG